MALHLTIENETALPDGGPLSVSVPEKRGIDIGRDRYLDWSLPDPTRAISGKHCEVRYRDGGFWLHDVSRNGTFLNRSNQRMGEPQRLRDGDRIEIGRYIVAVRIDGEGAAAAPPSAMVSAPAPPGQYWDEVADAAAPIARRDLRPASASAPVRADFSDWAVDVPAPPRLDEREPDRFGQPAPFGRDAPGSGGPRAGDDLDWARERPATPPPLPEPRRPLDWGAPPSPVASEAAPAPLPPAAAEPVSWSLPDAPAPAPTRSAAPAPIAPAQPEADNPWGTPSLAVAPSTAPRGERAPPAPDAGTTDRTADDRDIVRRFAAGAGIPPESLDGRNAGDLAEEAGALLRLAADHLKQLLAARAETKRVARTGSHTTVRALDNNPLKFSPSVEDALVTMLGRRSKGYLDARAAMDEGYRDLKTHQVKTYSAMQNALRLLTESLEPDAIANAAGPDHGLGGLLGSRKARLWDLFVTRWDTLAAPHENGMLDAFMIYFAECYDGGEAGAPRSDGRS